MNQPCPAKRAEFTKPELIELQSVGHMLQAWNRGFGVIDFRDPSTIATARAHIASLRWRIGVGALFAVGVALAVDSFQAGASWFLAIALSTCFDAMLGRSYVDTRHSKDQVTTGTLFVWGCAFSVVVTMAMMLHVAAAGGAPGRVLAVLIAASVFVSATLFLFLAPAFMMVTAAPAALCLMLIPFIPAAHGHSEALQGAVGVGCGVAGFLAYVLRAALQSANMVKGLREANAKVKARQREAEAKRVEAEEANKAKSEFLAVMTHELRTPLNAVIGYSEIIHEDLEAEGRKDLAADASRIGGSARHLLGLIDQILNFNSLEDGASSVSARPVNVRALINECVRAHEEDARERGNRMSVRVSADAEIAVTDADKLSVCLSALLSNAVKFTADGLIAVSAERERGERDMLLISVSDTGPGIAEADIQRLFKPFSQLDATTTREKGGMGLGLSVAQRVARALGGSVSVRSEAGTGSTFVIATPMKLLVDAAARAAA
ncbi:MAG: HAMP domain-containing sensor histidine kinase [Hyphomonadaceae bacterium]